MPDGPVAPPPEDRAEQAAVESDARLVRRVRLRLVAWSGLSTLLVLVVLASALYVTVANTLAAASVQQLRERVAPLVEALEGPSASEDSPQLGYQIGSGNTLLFAFDAQGAPVQIGRGPVAIPEGLPQVAGLSAANAAGDGTDVRNATLEIGTDPTIRVPIRILTRRVVALQDGNTYYLQVLQDRTTEVETLDALLAVLVVGGIVVVLVAFGFGTVYARRALVPIRDSLAAQRLALRRQREFAADASHELRTPLTVIRSSVEHLLRHRDRPVAESADALEDIDAEVDRLAGLVDDLLLLARSDSGAVSLDRVPLDLGDVAFDAASMLTRPAEARGVSVVVDPEPATVTGDPTRLRQLVTILVDNAVRHSPAGGTVLVTVRASGDTASVEVADEGPGLREDDMAHVFDRFWRAPGSPSGGTGLGLAIAKWIVEGHGGRIGVANREAGGAAFRVEVPASPGP